MFKFFFLISLPLLVLVYSGTAFAEAMSYETYQSGATFCDIEDHPWNKTSRVVGKIVYPELQSETVNAWMTSQIASEQSPLGKAYLEKALDPTRIGSFEGWRVLEVVQSAYNARMNTLFDCSVIEARINIIKKLQEAKALNWRSEIKNKLKKEMDILESRHKQCLPDEKGKNQSESSTPTTLTRDVTTRLVNSVTLQNCHYSKYLGYLSSRLEYDMSNTLTIDTGIGTGDKKWIPTDSDQMNRIFWQRGEQIRTEMSLAYRTLPRAMLAYQEMSRTYAAHLMLVIVYDDYVRLRDNLSKYMNATSQLFEKAYNAMTP